MTKHKQRRRERWAVAGLCVLLVGLVAYMGAVMLRIGSAPAPTAAQTPPPGSSPAAPADAGFTEAQVVEVVDGDTIRALVAGQKVTIRYIGIDTPELGGANGKAARAQNSALVGGRTVRLEQDVSATDGYGRLLRYVWAGDLMVNAELVRLGYARAVAYPPDTRRQARFEELQAEAKAAGRGLWALAVQTPVAGHEQVQITGLRRDGALDPQQPDEWVEITNRGTTAQDLAGWRLESERGAVSGQVFVFPQGFVMQPGQVCRVYTAEAHPEWCGLSFGYGQSDVWSNSEPDAALLYDRDGALVSRWE